MQSKAKLGVIILNISLKFYYNINSKVNSLELNRSRGSLPSIDDPALVRVHFVGRRKGPR